MRSIERSDIDSTLRCLFQGAHHIYEEIYMLKPRIVILAALFAAVSALSCAAIPEFVGTFSGSIKLNTYNPDGTKTKSTVPIQLEIAADNSTTLTLNGAVSSIDFAAYNGSTGFVSPLAQGIQLLTFQVKKTTIKGVINQVLGATPETAIGSDGKFKLKKIN